MGPRPSLAGADLQQFIALAAASRPKGELALTLAEEMRLRALTSQPDAHDFMGLPIRRLE